MYKVKISKDIFSDGVNLHLSASRNNWEAQVLRELADLMRKHEILKLHLSVDKTYFEVNHFPLEYLKGLLGDLEKLGFSVEYN